MVKDSWIAEEEMDRFEEGYGISPREIYMIMSPGDRLDNPRHIQDTLSRDPSLAKRYCIYQIIVIYGVFWRNRWWQGGIRRTPDSWKDRWKVSLEEMTKDSLLLPGGNHDVSYERSVGRARSRLLRVKDALDRAEVRLESLPSGLRDEAA